MRLLNTSTIGLLSDADTIGLLSNQEERTFKYAIFSHTWGDNEVIFEDIVTGNADRKSAYEKVRFACRQAAADSYDFIWIDNCCIDKSSSAELSEAINSMYVWYQQADTCYAYLADFDPISELEYQNAELKRRLSKCKWFKRGWTLQELLAPSRMLFFARDWSVIGTKEELRGILSSITGIDEEILKDPQRLYVASIAKRMSWAAERRTTRPEDLAYCLMGIFSVNMPMLYGEGGLRAFLRLQEEIMKQSDDQSLFAWTSNGAPDSGRHGLLADSPSAFKSSRNIGPYEDFEPRRPYQMTNRGLSIELPLSRLDDDTWVAALDCPVPPYYPDSTFLAVYLQKLSAESDQYVRTRTGRLSQVTVLGARQTIYVRQVFHSISDYTRPFPRHIFQIRNISGSSISVADVIVSPEEKHKVPPPRLTTSRVKTQQTSSLPTSTFSIARSANQLTVAIIFEDGHDGEQLAVMLGSSNDFRVGFDAVSLSDIEIDNQRLFKGYTSRFKPHDPELYGNIELINHDIRVKIDSKTSGASKYFMVDIDVVAKPRESFFGDVLNLSDEEAPDVDIEQKFGEVKRSLWGKLTTRTKKL